MSPNAGIPQTEDLLNQTIGKTPAPMSTDAVEQVEKIMGKRSAIIKISQDNFKQFILRSEGFVELFNHLDYLTKEKASNDLLSKKKNNKKEEKKE